MDPNVTIQIAIEAAESGDKNRYVEAMANYKAWLADGGFHASDELLRKLANITVKRLLFEADQMVLPHQPIELVKMMAVYQIVALSQSIDEEALVLANPVPDTIEGLEL